MKPQRHLEWGKGPFLGAGLVRLVQRQIKSRVSLTNVADRRNRLLAFSAELPCMAILIVIRVEYVEKDSYYMTWCFPYNFVEKC